MRDKRKQLRLPGYDYSQPGGYFVTVCTRDRENLLADICVGRDDLGAPCVRLTEFGQVAEQYLATITTAYKNVAVEKYVVMPNHVHLILRVTALADGAPGSSRPTQTVPRVIAAWKHLTNRTAGRSLWQNSYHDHVIRNEADYLRIWNYIDTNPARWAEDEYYNAQTKES